MGALLVLPTEAQQQDLPRFRSSVELTSIDAGVFDDRGHPIVDLKPEEFQVRIDGASRRVVSAQWISLQSPPGPAAPPAPDGYSTNDNSTGGRLILIAIDQPNIRFGGTLAIRKAMFAFIDGLEASDRAAIVGIGPGARSTPFTADRARLKKAVEGMVGQHQPAAMFLHGIGLAEAVAIERHDLGALPSVVSRECRDGAGRMLQDIELEMCVSEVELQAAEMARDTMAGGRDTIATLRALLNAMKAIEAPKTLILVSEGFLVGDERSSAIELGALAAGARTSIYALKLDDELFSLAASEQRAPVSPMNDRNARAEGLEALTGAARGSLFRIAGTGAGVFDRIRAELSGYYLLGVESGGADRDGKAHPIRVQVARRGATVRARQALLAPPESNQPRSARASVLAALASPLPLSALPLRVVAYSLRGPEAQKVQLLIHADVGADYTASRVVSVGYIISDNDGRIVQSQTGNVRLAPIMNGVPSPLQFSSGASLPPGDYLLKLAVAEGDRVGTVEHQLRAGVAPAGAVLVSDLMVGGPSTAGEELLQPTVGYSVVFGTVHGYVEAYGDGVAALTARYEIAQDADAPSLLDTDVPARLAGPSRAIFTRVMPVRQLPQGRYVLRVTLSSGGQPVRVTTRAFEVATPAVLMASAATSLAVTNDVYLPVPAPALSGGFNRSEVTRPAIVQAFRDRVPASARLAFDSGAQALAVGNFEDAERALKSAINPDDDSSALLAYLAAVYAASGHDAEAAGAWQTALIDGSDLPEVYDWLAGALIRTRDLPTARAMLEEAIEKWPSDARFAKPVALVYATFGQGVQAVRALARHLDAHVDDVESLFMGVEWIYQLHAAGAVARSQAEDVQLAKTYADAYIKAKGPQAGLVRRWMQFLESTP